MKKSFGEYTRLAKGPFGCSSLWAGTEHLLYVRGTGLLLPVSETYRRIRYSDITAVTTAPSPGWIIWLSVAGAWILVMFAIGLALNSGTFSDPDDLPVILAVFGALSLPALIVLIYNLVRGTTCIFAIETDSGILKIRTANRLKIARRVAPAIAEKIRALPQP